MEKYYGMYTQEGDDLVYEKVVKRSIELSLMPNQVRNALLQFALRNPQFEEAASETVFCNVMNEVLSVKPIDIVVGE